MTPVVPPPHFTPEQKAEFIAIAEEMAKRARGEFEDKAKTATGWQKYLFIGLAALACSVPYLIYKVTDTPAPQGQETTSQPAPTDKTYPLDDRVQGLMLSVGVTETTVTYQDGTKIPVEGLGATVVLLSEKDKLKLTDFNPADSDFPVVVFFNRSGFDATGEPRVVRRASDGGPVYSLSSTKVEQVQLMIPLRGGGFTVYHRGGGKPLVVSESDWYKRYMGIAPPVPLPPQDKLDKMSEEELKKLGLQRLSKEDYEKKFGKPPEDKKKSMDAPEQILDPVHEQKKLKSEEKKPEPEKPRPSLEELLKLKPKEPAEPEAELPLPPAKLPERKFVKLPDREPDKVPQLPLELPAEPASPKLEIKQEPKQEPVPEKKEAVAQVTEPPPRNGCRLRVLAQPGAEVRVENVVVPPEHWHNIPSAPLPVLGQGRAYSYDLVATWKDADGKPQRSERSQVVVAGKTYEIDLRSPGKE